MENSQNRQIFGGAQISWDSGCGGWGAGGTRRMSFERKIAVLIQKLWGCFWTESENGLFLPFLQQKLWDYCLIRRAVLHIVRKGNDLSLRIGVEKSEIIMILK